MEDSIVVNLPRRDWAERAAEDLRAEGCRADLLGPDGDGHWPIRVTGAAATIALMRYQLHLPENRVCWETFVNSCAVG
ncbi:MAG TPA: hypothetical protein VG245_05155 [Candidatus Dormibacteraeota bacterium]|nr:hypothetical protein [Candidatus Dormibacteraeota bacterium]